MPKNSSSKRKAEAFFSNGCNDDRGFRTPPPKASKENKRTHGGMNPKKAPVHPNPKYALMRRAASWETPRITSATRSGEVSSITPYQPDSYMSRTSLGM